MKGGFKLKWQLTTGSANGKHDVLKWENKNYHISNKKDLSLMTIMNLVHESKVQRVDKSHVWKTLLKHRWDVEILKTNSCLHDEQISDVIYKTGQDLRLKYDWNLWIPEEDMAFGIELYSALYYCPEMLIESAKMSKLFESLITNKNLNTVVAATMHNIQPRAGDNIKDFTAINMWDQRLDERYNFSLGNNALPLMTTDNLNQLIVLQPPFLQHKNQHDNVSAIFGMIKTPRA